MRIPFQIQKTGSFTGHRDCIYALCGYKESEVFFSSGSDGLVVQWDKSQGDTGKVLAKVAQSVYALQYQEENNCLLIAQNFEGLHRISLETLVMEQSAKLTEAAIFDICLLPTEIVLTTGHGEVIFLDSKSLQTLRILTFSQKSARCVVLIEPMNCIAVGYSDGHIRIISLHNYVLVHEIQAHTNSVFALHFHKTTGTLVSGSRDAHLKSWDITKLPLVPSKDVPAHLYAINAIVQSPDGKYFATASMDKSIKLWDAQSLQLLKVINKGRDAGHGTSVNKLLWGPISTELVSASDDRTLSLWQIQEISI